MGKTFANENQIQVFVESISHQKLRHKVSNCLRLGPTRSVSEIGQTELFGSGRARMKSQVIVTDGLTVLNLFRLSSAQSSETRIE